MTKPYFLKFKFILILSFFLFSGFNFACDLNEIANITPVSFLEQAKKVNQESLIESILAGASWKDFTAEPIKNEAFNWDQVMTQLGHKKYRFDHLDSYGYTPLHWAIQNRNKKAAMALIKSSYALYSTINFNQYSDNRKWKTPLHLALLVLYEDIALEIIKRMDIGFDAPLKDGTTAMHLAAERGYGDIVRELVLKNANVNVINSEGQSPLFVALINGHKEIAKILLFHGANLQEVMTTAKAGSVELKKILHTLQTIHEK